MLAAARVERHIEWVEGGILNIRFIIGHGYSKNCVWVVGPNLHVRVCAEFSSNLRVCAGFSSNL